MTAKVKNNKSVRWRACVSLFFAEIMLYSQKHPSGRISQVFVGLRSGKDVILHPFASVLNQAAASTQPKALPASPSFFRFFSLSITELWFSKALKESNSNKGAKHHVHVALYTVSASADSTNCSVGTV